MTVSRNRILVIDDEPQIHRFLGRALDVNGFEMLSARTGGEGLAAIAMRPPDAVVLDLALPDMDGQEVLVEARQIFAGPIVIMSARHGESEKVQALDNSADDYIEKPFGIGEFIARLRVALRHRIVSKGGSPAVRAGDLEIDLVHRKVKKAGVAVHLSPREYDLLAQLVQADGKVLTHAQLLRGCGGDSQTEAVQYLRVFIGHLRRKLEDNPSAPQFIVTESGVGYRFLTETRPV